MHSIPITRCGTDSCNRNTEMAVQHVCGVEGGLLTPITVGLLNGADRSVSDWCHLNWVKCMQQKESGDYPQAHIKRESFSLPTLNSLRPKSVD